MGKVKWNAESKIKSRNGEERTGSNRIEKIGDGKRQRAIKMFYPLTENYGKS